MEHPQQDEEAAVAHATAALGDAVRSDEEAVAAAWAHMLERARAGGGGAVHEAGELPDLVGAREQIMRMLENRIANGDAATKRRASQKLAQLQTMAGADTSA